jgi:hypothetical protein
MTIENSAGRPEKPGLYAAEIYFGWKLLEWHDGAWWHEEKWYYPKSSNEFHSGIFGWCGPLPVGRLDDPHPPCIQEYSL